MKNAHIAFVSPSDDRSLEKVIRRALAATGSRIETYGNPHECFDDIVNQKADLVIVNYDVAHDDTRILIRKLLDSPSQVPTIVLSQKKDKEHLMDLFSHDRLRNLVARNGLVSEEELIITTEKLLRKDIFGPEKYLSWGVHWAEEALSHSGRKAEHIQNVGTFVEQLGCDTRFIQLAQVVVDELLMNAFFDAPINAQGQALYAHLPRTERVQLDPSHEGSLIYGSNGRYLAIACRDKYGALEARTVVNYLRKCFAQNDKQVDTKPGGAGVGFYMIFQAVNQLIINIEPKKMTEIIGLIDIRSTYKDTKSLTKSFNIFLRNG